MRILIVDDDYVSRVKLKSLLAGYGDCDAVPSGELALDMVKIAYDEMAPYDLVTVDIDMPGMRGPEVVHEILKFEKDSTIKVLMITGKVDAVKEVMQSYREGCDWCIKKPVNPENIKDALVKVGITG